MNQNMIKFIGVDGKYDYKILLPFEIKYPKEGIPKDAIVIKRWVYQIKEKLKFMRYMDNIKGIIPVTEHRGRWVNGEYYAHEYPDTRSRADGKARRVDFKDADGKLAYTAYEVVCLDKSLKVMDGYWDEFGGSRIYSGTGDEFTPFEKGLGE